MRQLPILFSAPMVRALLDGRKTETRRIVKWTNTSGVNLQFSGLSLDHSADNRWELLSRDGEMRWNERAHTRCPYGIPGDQLWVREGLRISDVLRYDADGDRVLGMPEGWERLPRRPHVPAIFMPRWASRITLELADVSLQRLVNITEDECRAEGCAGGHDSIPNYRFSATPRDHYRWLWKSLNGERSWDLNPWVWVLRFTASIRRSA